MKTIHFKGIGYGGREYIGKGKLVETKSNGTHIVKLITDDYLGYGTYLRGNEIRVLFSEVYR